MAGFRSFREFAAWRLASSLRRAVVPLCGRAAAAKDYKLYGQITEAARSAPRNIAEGFGRYRHREFAQFVRIAKASEVELLNHFEEACNCGYLTTAERRDLDRAAKRAIKAASGLIRYLESTPDP